MCDSPFDLPPQLIEIIMNGEFLKANPPQEQPEKTDDERE
jgi:hypothetical protein